MTRKRQQHLQVTRWTALLLLTAGLSGCTALRQAVQNRPCALQSDRPYDVVTVDLARHTLALYWLDPTTREPFRSIHRLRTWLEVRGDSVIAITNAGIFEPGLIPTGLFIDNGHQLRPLNIQDGYGNFYLKPNGVFYTGHDGAGIVATSRFDTARTAITYAVQSGPLLVEKGRIHPEFTAGSTNCRLRSGIGITPDGTVHIAISNGAVNLYDFATYFRDVLETPDALYLDGSISALYAPGLDRTDKSRELFATFLAVTVKQ